MARKKKPENETEIQSEERVLFEQIANKPERSEKVSWNRKMDNLVRLMAQLEPIEQKLLEIISNEKLPLMDQVQELRETMVNECVHPFEYLATTAAGEVECKFCYKILAMAQNDG